MSLIQSLHSSRLVTFDSRYKIKGEGIKGGGKGEASLSIDIFNMDESPNRRVKTIKLYKKTG